MEKVTITYTNKRNTKPEKYKFQGKEALIKAQELLNKKYNGRQ